jgi:hypothetical protein
LRTVVYLLWWGCRMVGNLTIPPRICVIELWCLIIRCSSTPIRIECHLLRRLLWLYRMVGLRVVWLCSRNSGTWIETKRVKWFGIVVSSIVLRKYVNNCQSILIWSRVSQWVSDWNRSTPESGFGGFAEPFDNGGAGSASCSKGDWSLVLLQRKVKIEAEVN